MKALRARDFQIPSLISRIRAVVLAVLTTAVVATAPLTANATVVFDLVPDNPAITDVAGNIEISDTAFANRMADTAVAGEIIDFTFEFIANGRFPSSGTFGPEDLGVNGSDSSFKITINAEGTKVISVLVEGVSSELILFNAENDFMAWNPQGDQLIFVPNGLDEVDTSGSFLRRGVVPEPGSLLLFGVGLAGLAVNRRRNRKLHRGK